MTDDITRVRRELNEVDLRIVDALAERLELIDRVADTKENTARELRDLLREEEVLGRLVARGREMGVDESFVTRLYREIMDHSLRRQHSVLDAQDEVDENRAGIVVVGYQGTEGAYSHLAAGRHFGPRDSSAVYRGFDTFQEVAIALHAGHIDYGILPVENTTAGSINEVYDLLAGHDLHIVGEEVQSVDHCLLAPAGATLAGIRRILSHPQGLLQCSRFLARLTHSRAETFADTAMAARKVRDDGDPTQAAIASGEAARLYGLEVVKRNIADQRENFTRFIVVAREPTTYGEHAACKTSVIFSVRHEGGALAACLDVFAARGLNLTKIESRPRPNTPFEYLFYLDFLGNVADEHVSGVFADLAPYTVYLKLLGSYPARTRGEATRVARPRHPGTAGDEPVTPPTGAADPPLTADTAVLAGLEKKPYKLASRLTREADTEIRVGQLVVGGRRPVVIAGPCSVESREQIFTCARAVAEHGGDALRGGCFKPRTSPYSFQGLGLEGLDLLAEAGAEFGLPVVTEVLRLADVAPVAERADVLQIGARNMQNFALLKEVGRTHRPVILKRGMMSSIDEWLSAAEYILSHGNQQVILCERGIRTFETATRSTLDLTAVRVVLERSHLPVIVDPSHACGTWRWVPPMTRAALAAGAHGVMVEIHPDPDKALSDGPQALRIETFERMMGDPMIAGRPRPGETDQAKFL